MAPVVAWALGTAAVALYRYLTADEQSADESPEYVNVAWSSSMSIGLPRVVTRRYVDDFLCKQSGFRRVRSEDGADQYFRGDESITELPAQRKVRWTDVPLLLDVRYHVGGSRCHIELRYAAPESMTFDESAKDTFHHCAKREYQRVFDMLPDGPPPWGEPSPSRPFGPGDDGDLALLGLSRTASWPQIQSAYREACLKFHPDRLRSQNLPAHLVDLAVRQFRDVTDAYQRLKQELGQ
ncbi:MAG: J domain-containing protein [Phycisphaerales bacterium]|nr:J domain-containing protein [Phycisphaerales bacterium]